MVERDRDAVQRAIEAACDGERSHLEFEIVTFGGRRCRMESRIGPLRDESGVIIAALCMTRDVTQVRANEERLRESEARFRRLVERAPLGSFLNDTAGNTVYCNPRLAAIFGRPGGRDRRRRVAGQRPPCRSGAAHGRVPRVLRRRR